MSREASDEKLGGPREHLEVCVCGGGGLKKQRSCRVNSATCTAQIFFVYVA
jgi:hypothetical protein